MASVEKSATGKDVGSTVALYGGSFDPPHNGHLMVVGALLNDPAVGEVWLVPSGLRSDKKYFIDAAHRIPLARLLLEEAASGDKPVRLCTVELEAQGGIEGTVELFRELCLRYPTSNFSFVIGSDLLPMLPTWRHREDLKREVPFLVVAREGEEMRELEGYKLRKIAQSFTSSLSSTLVRDTLQSNKSVCGMMPASIAHYIEYHGLYGPTS